MPIFLGKLSSKEGVSLRMENKPKQEEIGRKVFWDWDSLYVGQNKVEQWKGKKKTNNNTALIGAGRQCKCNYLVTW